MYGKSAIRHVTRKNRKSLSFWRAGTCTQTPLFRYAPNIGTRPMMRTRRSRAGISDGLHNSIERFDACLRARAWEGRCQLLPALAQGVRVRAVIPVPVMITFGYRILSMSVPAPSPPECDTPAEPAV